MENYPDEMDRVIFCLDGAGYHRSLESRNFFEKRGLRIILLAPYSYLISVQEYVWAHLKRVNFNIEEIKTSQK